MEFTLYYRGCQMKAASSKNRRKREKHALRKHFHLQLKELWQQAPLADHPEFLLSGKRTFTGAGEDENDSYMNVEDITLLRDVGGFQFVPTVSEDLDMVADLTITLLRPEPPGRILTQGGDIDNRLKTLLDALKVPEPNDLPEGEKPSAEETPFFCLVSDDNLITSINIKTDQLFDPSAKPSEVVLLIHVRTRLVKGTWANLGLV